MRFILTLFRWIFGKLSNRQFLIAAAIIIGMWAGLSAVVLKVSVHFVQHHLQLTAQRYPWIYFISPAVGILLNLVFIRLVLNGSIAKGTAHVLLAIARNSSRLKPRETYAHLATSALTVGLGGSLGLESPIVQTGSAIGSYFSSFFPLNYRERTLLLACGAAAGIATAFNAPIAGVLFAVEVLLVNVNIAAFVPLLIAAATGALCSKIILSEGILLSFRNIDAFNSRNIIYYIVLGIICGLTSAYYIRTMMAIEKIWVRFLKSMLTKLLVGGLLLGITVWLFPGLFGEGYSAIKSMASSNPGSFFAGSPLLKFAGDNVVLLAFFTLVMAFTKVFAASFTLNAGGNGGNFAPSLLVGASIGFSMAYLSNASGLVHLPIANFCLVAMAGTLTGIFHSPLTAIFLIAEITGGYELMIPLMIVTALSTAVSKYFSPKSLDEEKLAQLSERINIGRDTSILSEMSLSNFIERDFTPVQSGSTLGDLTEIVSQSSRNIFPVIDTEGNLRGTINLEDIRKSLFRREQYEVIVDELMRKDVVTADLSEEIISIMDKFDDSSALWSIPVLESGKYIGFVSKTRIFSAYRDHFKSEL